MPPRLAHRPSGLRWQYWRTVLCWRAQAAVCACHEQNRGQRYEQKMGRALFAVSPFSLCLLPEAEALAQVQALRQPQERLVWLADITVPERNIEVPCAWAFQAILLCCGLGVHKAQRTFLARGGLEGLLYRAACPVQQRVPLWRGAALAVQVLVPPQD